MSKTIKSLNAIQLNNIMNMSKSELVNHAVMETMRSDAAYIHGEIYDEEIQEIEDECAKINAIADELFKEENKLFVNYVKSKLSIEKLGFSSIDR